MRKDGGNKENHVLVEDVVRKATADGGGYNHSRGT